MVVWKKLKLNHYDHVWDEKKQSETCIFMGRLDHISVA